CFSQLIFCGECNEMFRRIHWNNRGCKSVVWRCESHLQNTGVACRARTSNENLLQNIILKAINEIILDKGGYMKMLQENIATVIRNDASASTNDIDAKLLALQKELLKKANNQDAYDNIAEEIFQLRELKAKSETDSVIRDEKLGRITELCDFLKEQPSEITVFDESLVRRMLQKITVFDNHFTVEFKPGVSVDIKE
ncbi:MAG: zinc ribbon domain-containing protein, partial [Erysipelotrichaceae bacterium]